VIGDREKCEKVEGCLRESNINGVFDNPEQAVDCFNDCKRFEVTIKPKS